jgi:hypothetical protein
MLDMNSFFFSKGDMNSVVVLLYSVLYNYQINLILNLNLAFLCSCTFFPNLNIFNVHLFLCNFIFSRNFRSRDEAHKLRITNLPFWLLSVGNLHSNWP